MTMREIDQMPGLKASQIGKTIHGQGVASQGPVFYRVTVEQCVLDTSAIRRQAGLEAVVGSGALAAALGPDEDMAKIVQRWVSFVGMQDMLDTSLPLAVLIAGDGTHG
jgi:hypothetical protein